MTNNNKNKNNKIWLLLCAEYYAKCFTDVIHMLFHPPL